MNLQCPECKRRTVHVESGSNGAFCLDCDFRGVAIGGRAVTLTEAVGAIKVRRYDAMKGVKARPRCLLCRCLSDENRLCNDHLSLYRAAGSPPDMDAWARGEKDRASRLALRPRVERVVKPVVVKTVKPAATRRPAGVCAVAACGRPGVARNLCKRCYMRWRIHGRPDMAAWLLDSGRLYHTQTDCAVPGCERPFYSVGMCELHHGRWRAAGKPDPKTFIDAGAPIVPVWRQVQSFDPSSDEAPSKYRVA